LKSKLEIMRDFYSRNPDYRTRKERRKTKPPKKGRKWWHNLEENREGMYHKSPGEGWLPGRQTAFLRDCTTDEKKEYSSQWARNNHLVKKYGLTSKDYDIMLESQGSKCAICKTIEPGGRGKFHVDHNHNTGRVRGLLCYRCNVGIGYFDDDPIKLLQAIEYIDKC
jgi:hypothetical protein